MSGVQPFSTTQAIQNGLDRLRLAGPDREAAVKELIGFAYRRLEKLAERMSRKFPRLREDHSDVLHQCYGRLVRSLGDPTVILGIKSVNEFLGLAALQIRRELIDLSRRYARRREMSQPNSNFGDSSSSPVEPGTDTINPAQLATWTEFHQLVSRLPTAERDVFMRKWYHDLSFVELAQLMDIDERTARRRFQSAQRMLHTWLEGRLPF